MTGPEVWRNPWRLPAGRSRGDSVRQCALRIGWARDYMPIQPELRLGKGKSCCGCFQVIFGDDVFLAEPFPAVVVQAGALHAGLGYFHIGPAAFSSAT